MMTEEQVRARIAHWTKALIAYERVGYREGVSGALDRIEALEEVLEG